MLKKAAAIFVAVVASTLLLPVRTVLAYDEKTTHPALTEQVVDFYNALYPNAPLTAQEKEWIIEGSTLEDTPPRWVNHYYDPVYNQGWTGENTGTTPAEVIRAFVFVGLTPERALGSPDWVNSSVTQEAYGRYWGDHTWRRGLEYYADGDTREAYRTLGAALHLLEDAGVPDHTRNDTHVHEGSVVTHDNGSPYEDYAARFTRQTIGELGIIPQLQAKNQRPPAEATARDYIISMAKYSNHYFFSKDTINHPKYQFPRVDEKTRCDENFCYGVDENGSEFPLVKTRQVWNYEKNKYDSAFEILYKPSYYPILTAYFYHLAPQIVLRGAGVVDLFQRQAAEAIVNKEFPQHLTKLDRRAVSWFSFHFVSPVVTITKVTNASKSALAAAGVFFKHTAAAVYQVAANALGTGDSRPVATSPPVHPAPGEASAPNTMPLPAVTVFETPTPLATPAIRPPPTVVTGTRQITTPAPIFANSRPTVNEADLRQSISEDEKPEDDVNQEVTTPEELPTDREFPETAEQPDSVSAPAGPDYAEMYRRNLFARIHGGMEGATGEDTPPRRQEKFVGSTGGVTAGFSGSGAGAAFVITPPAAAVVAAGTSPPSTNTVSTANTTTSSAPLAASPPPGASNVSHLVISEMQVAGTAAGDEFVELYNPATAPVDISNWSLQYLSGTATSSAAVVKKNFAAGSVVPARGYFLIARHVNDTGQDGYRGQLAADMSHRSFTLSGAPAGGTVFLVGNSEKIVDTADGDIVDKVAYGTGDGLAGEGAPAPLPAVGQSIERRAWQGGSCVAATGAAEFIGNGCDTGENNSDFDIRAVTKPQNSQSMAEPRNKPTLGKFAAWYDMPAPHFDLSWDISGDAQGATSTVSYSVTDVRATGASSVVIQPTTSTAARVNIDEVGREYGFELRAQDRDGLAATTTVRASASSFVDAARLYPDSRAGRGTYVMDITTTSTRPFWGDLADAISPPNWKAIVFYLDTDAPKQMEIGLENQLIPADRHYLSLRYPACGGDAPVVPGNPHPLLLFPENLNSCRPGELSAGALTAGFIQDRRLFIPTAAATAELNLAPGDGDFVTMAFYDFGGGGGSGRPQFLRLVAVDKTRYPFQAERAPSAPPEAPGNLATVFDPNRLTVRLSWSAATDADTRDALLTYQFQAATSTQLTEEGWRNNDIDTATTTPVVWGNNYTLAVRAVDDFGNLSSPAVSRWSFPEGFAPLPLQTEHSERLSGGTAFQPGVAERVFITATTTIDAVSLWMGHGGGSILSRSHLNIYADAGGTLGELLADSDSVSLRPVDEPREETYTLTAPFTLNGNSFYWLAPRTGPDLPADGMSVYGSAGNAYPDGLWNFDSAKDAYFVLHRAGG